MKAIDHKHQILQSLNALDQAQTEKVLGYINGLLVSTENIRQQRLKREAMKEIRQALVNDRTLNPSF